MNKKMLGDTICRLRTEKGLSQAGLAELAGVNIDCVKKWEAYKESPNIALILLLSQLLEGAAYETGSDLCLYYYDYMIHGGK